jgi:hypothetical protein
VSDPGYQDTRNVPLVLGLVVGCVAYMTCILFTPPVLCYLPEVQEWTFSAPPDRIAMRYFGMPQWGIGGFVIGFFLARVRPIGEALARPAASRLLARVAATAVMGALLYVLVKELSHWGSLT